MKLKLSSIKNLSMPLPEDIQWCIDKFDECKLDIKIIGKKSFYDGKAIVDMNILKRTEAILERCLSIVETEIEVDEWEVGKALYEYFKDDESEFTFDEWEETAHAIALALPKLIKVVGR